MTATKINGHGPFDFQPAKHQPPTHTWIRHPEHAAIGWLKPTGRYGYVVEIDGGESPDAE